MSGGWARINRRGVAALAALAVVAIATSLLAFGKINASSEQLAQAGQASVEPTPTVSPRPAAQDALALLADAARPWSLLVVGDSTGNDSSEWVQRYALALGQATDRPVAFQRWDPDAMTYSADELTSGSGAPITVWNGSAPGERGSYVPRNADALLPADRPDLVIYNFGHNADSGPAALYDVRSVFALLDGRWGGPVPAAAILQNPQTGDGAGGQEQAVQVTAQWAAEQGATAVDVHAAFQAAPDLSALLLDDKHPSHAGSELWAETVLSVLPPPA